MRRETPAGQRCCERSLHGGPLAGIELPTTEAPWHGGWFTVGDTAGLYRPVHRDPVTGVVFVEVQVTIRPLVAARTGRRRA
ncbi:hypothetical protein [Streptomyces albidoflavus]|uniref:hypothetical protein n=1 Tax=Streptomyces albidoflavus TaxID=1886 RepID=UPI00331B8AD8